MPDENPSNSEQVAGAPASSPGVVSDQQASGGGTPRPEGEKILRKMEGTSGKKNKGVLIGVALVILAGIFTGYLFSRRGAGLPSNKTSRKLDEEAEMIVGPKEVGIKDERVFRDTAEGRLMEKEANETFEGSYKLLRPGGESQTAFLTSSVIDLSPFVGRCVQVWGETFAAQQAGWLMDVGRLKVLDSCPEGL